MGLYLSLLQVELFTAFLWLVECSVLFVFLLLLFYLNVKGTYKHTYKQNKGMFILFLFTSLNIVCNPIFLKEYSFGTDLSLYTFLENYYEAFQVSIQNDLFGFYISYYIINVIEFVIVGFLLLIGSIICVNLYQMNKNVRVQSHTNFLKIFNFFTDFSSFFFLRKQNLIKQGNTKPSLRSYKKL